jgi:hypothetical protein
MQEIGTYLSTMYIRPIVVDSCACVLSVGDNARVQEPFCGRTVNYCVANRNVRATRSIKRFAPGRNV